jgi:hypothetical protein
MGRVLPLSLSFPPKAVECQSYNLSSWRYLQEGRRTAAAPNSPLRQGREKSWLVALFASQDTKSPTLLGYTTRANMAVSRKSEPNTAMTALVVLQQIGKYDKLGGRCKLKYSPPPVNSYLGSAYWVKVCELCWCSAGLRAFCASAGIVKSRERGEKLLAWCMKKGDIKPCLWTICGHENSCPEIRQQGSPVRLPLMKINNTPLRLFKSIVVFRPYSWGFMCNVKQKSWPSKPRGLLKLIQHSLSLVPLDSFTSSSEINVYFSFDGTAISKAELVFSHKPTSGWLGN